MPRQQSSATDKEGSSPRLHQSSLPSTASGTSVDERSPHSIQPSYSNPIATENSSQPTYSQTILQPPTLATDPSTLPPQHYSTYPPSATSRRQSTGSMRNASMTFETLTPTATPTGRISKAKKGKRVHACEFPGCGKVFTRAEHRRRHELNHNPDSVYKCSNTGCGKSFHRIDLLQRHQERHEAEASPPPSQGRPQHGNVYSPPPSVLASSSLVSPRPDAAPRTSSGGLSITSLVHPQQQQYSSSESALGFNLYMQPFSHTVEPYYYGSEGSHSPVSEHIGHYHRPSISSSSSVNGFEPSSLSPTMTASIPGWVPATSASVPPVILPSNVFEEGQASYIPSQTVNSLSVLSDVDGREFDAIQRELSTVPGLIFDSNRPDLPRYIRSDCLEHYWKYFHPSFPIVYKPNFVTNTPPPLLLSAVLAIGSFYDSRPDAKLYSLALQEIATRLLRQRNKDSDTKRPRIADLQTVLLLEVLSKYCARHTVPETSARFRGLFASLQQRRELLTQNPLAIFNTLKPDRTSDDLKRAHKFWLEHEARRRIYHACSVLDAQQIALFNQKATIITHGSIIGRAHDLRAINLPCDEDLWDASPLEEWASRATESRSITLRDAQEKYALATVADYSFFQHQIINVHAGSLIRCSDEVSSPPQQPEPPSKTRFNYHVFQMARYVPVKHLLVVAGESWYLGKKIEQESEYTEAKKAIRAWIDEANTVSSTGSVTNAVSAHWHALKVLRMLFDPNSAKEPFRSTHMLHEDWSVYLAALVCWARGYGRAPILTKGKDILAPTTTPPSVSRKRKNTELETPPRKRQATMQSTPEQLFMPSTTSASTPIPAPIIATSYADSSWTPYGSTSYPVPWADTTYYDTSLLSYPAPSDAVTLREPSTYAASSAAATTAHTRTATNTPQSQSSRATTAVPMNSLAPPPASQTELKAYLDLTDVSAAQYLMQLDNSILSRTKGLLNTIRIHKIGAKRVVGGLMNDAERVLARLAEQRNLDMF